MKKKNKHIGPLPDGLFETEEQVARAFQKSTRMIQFWKKDGMPVRSDGLYSLAEIQAWRLAKSKKKDSPTKTKADERYREFKALMVEQEYKKRKGELLVASQVEDRQVKKVLEVKTKLLSFPRGVAPKLVGQDVQKIEAILSEKIKEIISDFAGEKHRDLVAS